MNNIALYEEEKTFDILKSTICKGLEDEEIHLFGMVCTKTGLDPFCKQIYPVKRYDSKLRKDTMTIQTGIDGLRLIAERTGKYSPGKEPEFRYDKNNNLICATSFIKKQTEDGTWHEISATAVFSEYVQIKQDGTLTSFWQKMPHNQLAKCAEALALRRAFPVEMSGIYTKEEMDQSQNPELEEKKKDEARLVLSEDELTEAEVLLDLDPEKKENIMKWLASKGLSQDLGVLPVKTFNLIVKNLKKDLVNEEV